LTLIYNARLIDAGKDFHGAVLVADDGTIAAVMETTGADVPDIDCADGIDAVELIDAENGILMPSFIDMHVHFRYPGQSAKEDLISGSKAAVHGGYGCVVLMPNTSPVVSDVATALDIEDKVADTGLLRAFQTMSITKGFSGNDISHLDDLNHEMAKRIPVISEDGKDVASPDVMKAAMEKCAAAGVMVSCHCEEPSLVPEARRLREARDFAGAERVLAKAEDDCTERNLQLAAEAGCDIHIAHCSTAQSLNYVRAAKAQLRKLSAAGQFTANVQPAADVQVTAAGAAEGADVQLTAAVAAEGARSAAGSDAATGRDRLRPRRVTCEVTPHHFGLSYEMPGMDCQLVNPPLRSEDDREACIAAILDGTADVISTDHAPHTDADKAAGACGFTGIETAFAASYTTLVDGGYISMRNLSRLMSAKPAELLGLNCGLLEAGREADLVLVDEGEWVVDTGKFESKGKFSPLQGQPLKGRVLRTWFRGKTVYQA